MASLVADLYKELRRLSIAGGELGAGDFRLAKILPQLKGAAEKAPVFGQLAAGVEKISAPNSPDRSAAILETAALARAVMCVQAKPEPVAGELSPLPETGLDISADQFSYRVIGPIKEALTTKGGGRRLVLEEGLKNGAAADVRLLPDLRQALEDGDGEIAAMAGQALQRIGRPAVECLMADFKPKGRRKAEVLRLEILGHILGSEGRAVYARAWSEGSAPVRRRSLEFLALSPENDALLVEALGADLELAEAAALSIAANPRTTLTGPLAEAAAELLERIRPLDFRKLINQKSGEREAAAAAQGLVRFLIFLSVLGRSGHRRSWDLARAALDIGSWRNLELSRLVILAGGGLEAILTEDPLATVHGLSLTALTAPADLEPQVVLAEIRGRLAGPNEPEPGLLQAAGAYCYRTMEPDDFLNLFKPLFKKD